jgi:hypothetical protein
MEKLNTYRTIIKEVLTRYYELDLEQPTLDVEPVLAFDEVRDHYFWAQVVINEALLQQIGSG